LQCSRFFRLSVVFLYDRGKGRNAVFSKNGLKARRKACSA